MENDTELEKILEADKITKPRKKRSKEFRHNSMKGKVVVGKSYIDKKKLEMSQAELRSEMKKIVQQGMPEFFRWLNEIEDPRDKCEVFLKMTKFVLPTLNSVESDITLNIKPFAAELAELAEEE